MFQNFECFDVLTFSTFLSREIINDLQKRVKRSEGRPHDFSGASMSDNVDAATTTTTTVMTAELMNLRQGLDNYDKDDKDDDDDDGDVHV